jgi:hypothetical protein
VDLRTRKPSRRSALNSSPASSTPAGKERGWAAHQLMQFKHSYLDGDLCHWTAADLSEVLLQLCPCKVVLEPGVDAEVLAGTAAFLRFLNAKAC